MLDSVNISSMPRTYTVAEAILEQLRLWGVQRIYGVIGDAVFGLIDALAKQEDISFIAVKHESVAAMMASAEAKLTGHLAVCLTQMGPGLANLVCGLGDAYMDRVPVLAISGQAPLNKIGTAYKQFINQQEMVQAVSIYSQIVVHPDAILDAMTKAMSVATTQHSVSHLSIPQDLFSLFTQSQPSKPPQFIVPSAAYAEMPSALVLMKSAKNPMILAGTDNRIPSDLLHRLAEKWGCGIAMSYGAVGIVPDTGSDMLNGLGEGGNPYLSGLFQESDVVLALETDWWPEQSVPRHARVIQIARQRESLCYSMPMNMGIVGDLTFIVQQMIDGMNNHVGNPEWMDKIKRCKEKWSEQNDHEGLHAQSPLHPSSIIRAVEQTADDDAIIALDEGDSTLWFLRNFRAERQQVLLSNRWRTMGFGLPAAIAAKLCFPNKQVVCITGDGGLCMVLADLLTAVRYRLKITVILFHNDTLQMERDKMFMKGLQPEGSTLTNPDFVQLAEASGWTANRITRPEKLAEALILAKSSIVPVLLDVQTARFPYPEFQ